MFKLGERAVVTSKTASSSLVSQLTLDKAELRHGGKWQAHLITRSASEAEMKHTSFTKIAIERVQEVSPLLLACLRMDVSRWSSRSVSAFLCMCVFACVNRSTAKRL